MADGGRIDFTVGFKSDTQGLQQIKAELNELRKITPTMLKEINPTWDMSKARSEFMKVEKTINEVSKAFDNAFNPQLGVANIQKLNSSLQKIGIDKIYNQFSSLGTVGTQAFQKLASQALTTNIRLKESSTILDKIGNTLMNTIKWNISSSVVNGFTNSIQQAWGYVKHLDTSLNDIRIVTGKSADEMDKFAEKANKAAKRLGASTTDYTEASLIYYQQGLSDEETAARAETAIKAANVTGQSGEAVSEQLTAVWNGYKVSAEEAELYIDKLAAVAATTASDLEELSTGMSRVASAAAIMGVDIDQLNAQLATIVSVTREAPESIGTALKTVYARMSDIKAGLDGEVSLDEYTQQMEAMGINVLDANSNLRDMGDIIEEIGSKWQTMTREQQTSLAQTIAGTRQYSRMMSLFDNWDMYTKALETSANAVGTLNEQNEIYLESTKAHLEQFKTSVEGIYDSLIDTEGMNDLIDVFTNIVTLFNHFLDGIGGAKTALMLLGTVGVKAFAKPMQDGLVRLITNFKIAKDNAAQLKAEMELTQALSNSKAMENPLVKQMVEAKQAVQQYYGVMSQADLEQSNALINQLSQAQALEAQWKKDADAYNDYAKQIVSATAKQGGITGVTEDRSNKFNKGFDITKDKNAKINMEALQKSSKNVDDILNSTNVKLKDIKKLTTEWNQAQVGVNKSGRASEDVFEDIKTRASAVKDEVLKNAEVFDALGVDVTKVSTLLKKVKIGDPQSVVDFRKELEVLLQEAQKTKGQMDNLGDSAKAGLDGAKLAAQQAKAAFDNFLNTQSIKNFSQGLTSTISSLGQLGMGFTSLANLPKIFDNENLSTGEKFAQVLSSLSMGVITLSQGFKNLVNGGKLISSNFKNVTKDFKTVLDVTKKQIAAQILEKQSRHENAGAITEEMIAQKAANISTKEAILLQLKLNAAKLAAILAVTALAVGITAAMNAEKKAREEEAAIAANRSKIAQENLKKTNEEKEKIDELATNYERLREQERIGEISKADMAKQTADLVNRYGDENTKLIEMTGNYKKLEEAIRDAQAAANEDAISSAQFAQTAAGDKAAGEMWRDMTGAQRDTVKGKRAIDLGTEPDVNEIADVLKEFDIERLGTGHISLEDVTEAIQTDAQGFIAALEENGSSTATELLSILRATEGLDEAIAAQTAEVGAKIDQINLKEPIKEGSITTVEDFNNAVDSLTEQYVAAGKAEEEAYQMAYDYVSGIDETTQLIGNLNKSLKSEEWNTAKDNARGALEKNIEVFDKNANSQYFFDDEESTGYDYKGNITALKDEVDKIMAQNTAMAVSEAINYALQDEKLKEAFSNLPGGENYLRYIKNIASNSLFKGETFEDLQKEASSLSSYNPNADKYKETYYGPQQNEFDYTQLRNDIIDAYSTNNPDQAPFLALIEDLPQKLYDKGYNTVEEAQGFIDQEIFNTKLENFSNSASNLLAGLQPLLENARYITPDALAQDPGWKDISAYEDILKVKGFGDEFDTVQDENATEEERTAALQEIIGYLASISEVQNGLYTKEKAAEEGLTETALTESLNKGDIDQEQYQQKFQGAMDYELEELGINQEEFEEYADAVEDLTEQYELSDEMIQRIAKDNLKLQKTVNTLASNWEEYGDVLKSGDKTNIKYAQGMSKMRESVEDMFGIDISDDFIQEHLEEIQQLAEGDLTVFDELQIAAAKDYIASVALDDSQAIANANELMSYLDTIDLENIDIGATLDTTEFGSALTQMLYDAGMTADEISDALNTIGFEPEVTYLEVPAGSANYDNQKHTYDYVDPVSGKHYTGVLDSSLYSAETGMVKIPVINGSKTSFRGNATGAIQPPKSSGGGGGGGGGGGSKPKDPDKMDKSNDEIDRYHDINIILKQLETQFDRLSKAQEKLIGKDLIDNLNQQLKILEKQKQTLAKKIELERQEAAELQGDLSKEGVKFNEDGTIANYADALKAKENYVNSLIEKYNGMSAEEQESYKETVEKAKEDYEKLKENIDRYDTVITDEIPGLEDQIQDIVDQEIEINVKKFTMGIELRLEIKEAEQDWNKFKRKIIDGMKDDNIFGQGKESLENYRDHFDLGGGQGGTVDALTKQVNDTMTEIQKMQAGELSKIFGNDMSKAMKTLTTYNSELITQLENMEDLVESIEQGLLDTMDEVKEKMEAQVEAYEYVNILLESDMELVQMLYGEDSYEALGNYYTQKHENYKQALDFDKQEVAFWQQETEAAKTSGNEEAYQKALENYREGVKKLNEDVEASVQNIIDSYSNTINQIFDKLDKKMSGKAGGMDLLREEWELINTNAERYLDTINSTYEVQKLQNKYKTSINAAENIKVQQKLNALMEEEIRMLEKKDKLSQYDIDRANMKYDIALKQIALEEAQQNKSSMRMKRDAQGNYSYVYAGDEDDISSKTQELADAQNQLYNLDKDQYRQNMDDIVSYTAEMQEKIKELYEDPTMDPEVRGEREKTIREQYGELINNIIADNENIRVNLHESTFDSLSMLYETDADNFRTMTGLENDDWNNMTDDMLNNIQTKMIPTWDGSVQHMIDTFIADGGIGPTIDQVFKDADKALKNYESSLSEVEAAAGISFDAIKSGTEAASESAKELIGDNKEIMDQCKEQVEEYKALIAQVKDLATAYNGVRDAAIRAANAAHTLAEEINNQSTSAAEDPTVGPNMPKSSDSNGSGKKSANSGSSKGSGDGVLNVGDEATYTGGKYYEDSYGGGKSGERGPGKKVKVTIIKDDGRPYPIHVESEDSAYGWLKKEQLSGFKSGGFTGSWQGGIDRDDGRLALLHQKELVLNANDTDNFLKAMQELRQAQNEIKTVSSSGVVSAMFNSISDVITAKMQNLQSIQADMLNAKGPVGSGLTGTIQNITINADFPEVSDANEIRKAFDQIIGLASQKAGNKSR